jgi:hypothetical protein
MDSDERDSKQTVTDPAEIWEMLNPGKQDLIVETFVELALRMVVNRSRPSDETGGPKAQDK